MLAPFSADVIPAGARIAITAHRHLTREGEETIARTMRELLATKPAEFIFGGARGGDTVALRAVLRPSGKGTRPAHWPRLVVIVPDTVDAQPHDAREAIRAAAPDEVVELHQRVTHQDGFAAYHRRNEAMADRATHVVAFWNRDRESGTGACVRYALRINRPVRVVDIIGGDS